MAQASLIPTGRNPAGVFEALCAHPYGIKLNDIIPYVWPDPDQEPEYPESGVQVCIVRMNRWWRERGIALRIKGTGGPGSRYQMWIGPFV